MSRRALCTVILSVLGHALFLRYGAPRAPEVPRTIAASTATSPIASVADSLARNERTREARRKLVESARSDRKKGRLALGRFLLEANRIDAEEAGEELDVAEALIRYEDRLSRLRQALREGDPVTLAVPWAFEDIKYYGQPGGRMADALLDGGGSCEQVAQLVVAAVFDAGKPAEVALRFYGKPMSDGVAHLAPIAIHGKEEHDLMAGTPATPGGSRVAPDELVEVYARVHGLAPPIAAAASGGGGTGKEAAPPASAEPTDSAPSRPSLSAGFPPNADVYPGTLPLYAVRAVKQPGEPGDVLEDPSFAAEGARHCAYFLRMASLSPPTIEVEQGVTLEPYPTPRPQRLEREAFLLRVAQDLAKSPQADEADRLMSLACLTALGEVAGTDFTLAGERRLANAAVATGKQAREAGEKALAAIRWSSEDGARIAKRIETEYAGRSWILLFLKGGGDVVLDLTLRAPRDNWGRVNALGALVLFPETRARAIEASARLPLRDQVDVMHEVFHAHDHLRPWATNFDLETPPNASEAVLRFVRAYRVFRGVAFRLWEGQREAGETLAALSEEARAAGLDRAWEAAMIDYHARNVLGLYAQRSSGFEVVAALVDATRGNPDPSLDPLRKQLAYIEAEGRLDARTLADAFRMR
ncbi:hypothetical protein [Polyangium jinanense]|uniref:Transglutaminase-like domain-containing protein n=1 Tax=Polyangium jinanense TaxID=2829994 RepID=A0A9X3X1U6_9BACT|nr:hypothetical protein [Polyangium jinanense]MDC3953040.1 hypothetical protein [Polyangium jinanense]MDC3980658.1 hypothetical protein [Polyangium jinanense]